MQQDLCAGIAKVMQHFLTDLDIYISTSNLVVFVL